MLKQSICGSTSRGINNSSGAVAMPLIWDQENLCSIVVVVRSSPRYPYSSLPPVFFSCRYMRLIFIQEKASPRNPLLSIWSRSLRPHLSYTGDSYAASLSELSYKSRAHLVEANNRGQQPIKALISGLSRLVFQYQKIWPHSRLRNNRLGLLRPSKSLPGEAAPRKPLPPPPPRPTPGRLTQSLLSPGRRR